MTTAERHVRDIGKTRGRGPTASPGTPIEWRDVLRALSSNEARAEAVRQYRAAGFAPDDFEHRTPARRAMAEVLTTIEDDFELRGVRLERQAIQRVRRALECEVWS